MKKTYVLAATLLFLNYLSAQVCPDPLATKRKVASSFHSSVMIDYTGVVKYWGDGANPAAPAGNSYVLSPTNLSTGLYTGTPVAVAASSAGAGGDASYNHQLYLLTTTFLYGWGASNATITATAGKTPIVSIALPQTPIGTVNLLASNIDFIASSGGGIAIVTKRDGVTNGEVYIKNGASAGGASPYTYGDGTIGTTFNTSWHRAQTAAGVNLTGVARLSYGQKGVMAQTVSGTVYVWGEQVWAFPGSGSINTLGSYAYATPVLLPDDGGAVTPADINILTKAYDANAQYASQFVLGTNGKLYGIGEGYHGILGQGTETDATDWVKVKGTAGGATELTDIVQISSNTTYVYTDFYYSIGALNSNGQLYLWGDNNSNMLGGTAGSFSLPRIPPNFSINDARVGFFHMGGHTTIAFLRGSNRFCYVGHLVRGSMGNGTSTDGAKSSYDCINTPDAYICEPPPPLGCAAPSANDLVASSNHATLVINGQPSVTYWGQGSSSAEAGINVPTPRVLYEYNGTPKGVAASAVAETPAANATQMWILTTEGLWGWGYSANTITSSPGAVGLTTIALPVPVANVSFIRSSRGGVALVTTTGAVWIKAGAGSACSFRVYGDGSSALNTAWHQVKTSDAGNPALTGVTELSFGGTAAMAVTPAGVYVWGTNTYLGNGTASANRSYATIMPALHSDFTGTVIPKGAEIIQSGTNGAAEFILGSNGKLYSTGNNINGVLGLGDLADRTSWTAITTLTSIRKLSSNNPFATGYSIGALTLNGTLYLWGSNSSGMLGADPAVTTQFITPTIPADIASGSVAGFEMGGHETIVFPIGGNQFYFAGDNIGGSKGDNTADGNIIAFTPGANVVNCAGVVYTISGHLYNDSNGITDGVVNGNGVNQVGSTILYANLLDDGGYVVGTSAITPSTGAYTFTNFPSGNYTLQISDVQGTLFTPAPGVTIPAPWNFVGEQIGIVPNVGVDGTADGRLPIALTSTLTNANIGVERTPTAVNVNTAAAIVAPVGNNRSPVPALQGNDAEDQPATGLLTGKTVAITSLPSNGTLYYNGLAVTAGTPIPNYDPSLLTVDPDNSITQLTFPYSYVDAAGIASSAATVTMNFRYETITGNVFHDANGLNDAGGALIQGPVLQAVSGVPLYVSLIDPAGSGTILATVPVLADGSFAFSSIVPAGNLKVVLHTTPGTLSNGGSLVAQLPASWSNAGEQVGVAAGAGVNSPVNGTFDINVVASPFTSVNFGVEQTTIADPKTYMLSQPYLGQVITLNGTLAGTATPPGQLTGSDPEDGVLNGDNNNRTVVIKSLPSNGVLRYNGILVTAGQVITGYNKNLLTITLAGSGYITTGFTYVYRDAASAESAPVNYALSWGFPLPVQIELFTAVKDGSKTKLDWRTGSEQNNVGFNVERSNDGINWEKTGFVPTQAPNGNSNASLSYVWYDISPKNSINQYRLKQMDKDGHFIYSDIRSVRFGNALAISILPNPATESITVKGISGNIMIRIVDMSGRVLKKANMQGGGNVLSVRELANGSYIVQFIKDREIIEAIKLLKK